MRYYILGYGSLVESESRRRTTPNAVEVHPVVITGYERGWFARVDVSGISTTFLGCRFTGNANDLVNGLIYEVEEADIPAIDKRENNYVRTLVKAEELTVLSDLVLEDAEVYVYLSELSDAEVQEVLPTKEYPIVQSYVDICVNGCIEIEAAFPKAKEFGFVRKFISETKYWSEWWANDRVYPRRPFIFRSNAYQIDGLLREHLADPALFDKIYIE